MSSTDSNGQLPTQPIARPKPKSEQIADLLIGKTKPDSGGQPEQLAGSGDSDAGFDSGRQSERRPEPSPPQASDRPALELDDDDTGDPKASSKDKRGRSATDYLAETGMKERDFYNLELDVGLAGEAPVSIGALKDHFRESRNFERERDDFEDYVAEKQNLIASGRQNIQDIFNRLAGVVPQETMARVFSDVLQDNQVRLEQAREQLREYFPQWSDAAALQADRAKLETHLASYGFTRHEVANVLDPRLIKYAMDAMRLKERYDRRLAELRDVTPSKEPPARRQHRPSVNEQAKALAARGDKTAAVAMLIQGSVKNGNYKSR